jgi:ABC-type glutathione transport system ATPase component
VYRDILRGRIFQGLLRRLGFETKVFIIGDEDMAPLTGDFSGSIVQLTSDVEETESLLRSIGTEWMQPAFIRGRRGSIARFSELSSGEQQVLSMVIRLVATVEPGTLFLIDEPEISLHVSWQKSLPSLLGMILREFECDVVVATHSPLVISSATGTRDHCFVTRRQRLEPIHREDQHSVESILLAGFETYTPNNRLVHERCAAIVAAAIEAANSGTGERDVIAKLRDDLSQMRRILKDQREESDGSKDSERLIAKAREAVEQISRWRDVPMTPAEEN